MDFKKVLTQMFNKTKLEELSIPELGSIYNLQKMIDDTIVYYTDNGYMDANYNDINYFDDNYSDSMYYESGANNDRRSPGGRDYSDTSYYSDSSSYSDTSGGC